jgi:hypothetical protein
MALVSTVIRGFGIHDQKFFFFYSFTDDKFMAERNISLLFSSEAGNRIYAAVLQLYKKREVICDEDVIADFFAQNLIGSILSHCPDAVVAFQNFAFY